MENIVIVDNLTDHPLGLQRKVYVESLEIYPSSFTVTFYVKYYKNDEEIQSSSLQTKKLRFVTSTDDYNVLLQAPVDPNKTIYENVLDLIKLQVSTLVSEG